MQKDQLPKKNIREIQPNPFLVQKRLGKKLRVAAYCRVSTAQEEQELSFESQVAYYTNLIENNPEWELVEIFADHGISGTKDTTRPGFMKMIDACKKHKVDLILTKSMSRFARNTLDCLKYIRLLKSLDVTIEFEKEGLNTSELSSEIYLTWFSAFAQAESESLSQNVTMGKRRLYKEGHFTFQYKHFLGYRKGADGRPEIDPEQAETVKRIFYGFLAGKTPQQLKLELEREGIPSPTGKAEWSKATIQNMLRNEKYVGDVLLQKTYTADFLTKKIKKNQGEIAQYYITDNHPAIIPRDVFQEVQLELARRSSKRKVSQKKTKTQQGKYTSKFALSERLVCGECGAMYRRTMWVKRDGTKENVWRCVNRLEFGRKNCKDSPSLKEPALQRAILNCIQSTVTDRQEIANIVRETEKNILIAESSGEDPTAMFERIRQIDQEMSSLLELVVNSDTPEIYDGKFKSLSDEKAALQKKLDSMTKQAEADSRSHKRLEKLLGEITESEVQLTDYNDEFIRRVVEQVTVLSATQIEVRFVGGYSKIGSIE